MNWKDRSLGSLKCPFFIVSAHLHTSGLYISSKGLAKQQTWKLKSGRSRQSCCNRFLGLIVISMRVIVTATARETAIVIVVAIVTLITQVRPASMRFGCRFCLGGESFSKVFTVFERVLQTLYQGFSIKQRGREKL